MNGGKAAWAIVCLAAIIGALAALLAVEYIHKSDSRAAYGQTGEPAAGANYVLSLMGNTVNDATPIVVIDTKAQTILVYEYMVSTKALYLRAARTYINDRELLDNFFFTGNSYTTQGQTLNDVKKLAGGRR
jgi:hypothetical protein